MSIRLAVVDDSAFARKALARIVAQRARGCLNALGSTS